MGPTVVTTSTSPAAPSTSTAPFSVRTSAAPTSRSRIALRLPLTATAIAAILNLALDILLIPRFDATGAAIANTAAQMVAAALVGFLAWRILRPFPVMPAIVARGIVAATAAGVAAWLVAEAAPGAVALALGIPTYLAVLVLAAVRLGVLAREDAVWLAEAADRRGLPAVGPVFRLLAA